MSGGPSLPSSPSSYASPYQPPNQGQAASGALGGAGQIAGSVPGAQATGSNIANAGAGLTGQANNALSMTAFNPQQYAQQYQQQQDQTNAALSQQGVAGTPYGAGLAAQQNQNFNNNWNTQQIGLENTAANTASTLLGSGSTAQALGTQLPNSQLQTAIQDYLSYLGQGTSASNAATSQYGAESSAALGQQQVNNSALGGLGSALGSLFGGAGGLSGVGSGLASLGTLFL